MGFKKSNKCILRHAEYFREVLCLQVLRFLLRVKTCRARSTNHSLLCSGRRWSRWKVAPCILLESRVLILERAGAIPRTILLGNRNTTFPVFARPFRYSPVPSLEGLSSTHNSTPEQQRYSILYFNSFHGKYFSIRIISIIIYLTFKRIN